MASTARSGPVPATWALAPVAGYVYDVQVRLPGATTWTNRRPNATSLRGDYTPALTGTYGFRARLERISSASVSAWSPTASVSVS